MSTVRGVREEPPSTSSTRLFQRLIGDLCRHVCESLKGQFWMSFHAQREMITQLVHVRMHGNVQNSCRPDKYTVAVKSILLVYNEF